MSWPSDGEIEEKDEVVFVTDGLPTAGITDEEYFALAQDHKARPHLQSGTNVVIGYRGQVIAIEDGSRENVPGQGVSTRLHVPVARAGQQDPRQAKDQSNWLALLGSRPGYMAQSPASWEAGLCAPERTASHGLR